MGGGRAPGAKEERLIPPGSRRPFLIAGPCVLEDESMALRVADAMAVHARGLGLFYIFKASYLKDNRTSGKSYTGPGLERGLRVLAKVRSAVGVPILTDVHSCEEVDAVAAIADVLQIPAFLCRQSRLLAACAATGKALNIKKGQFLAPADMAQAVAKVSEVAPGAEILLTERGSCFGYRDLVVDMRGIALMRSMGCRVVFDATHALQKPGKGGDRRFAASLARAALGAGAEGMFVEVHPDPSKALSDATTQLPLEAMPRFLKDWARLGDLIEQLERSDTAENGPDWPGLERPVVAGQPPGALREV
ncbi:MAG: 3-deoxy-8-phosphooctulonate synthase [Candidatus Eisenbacteria sp.]|nr:3-deoxy-8-phosphooctulonate synthase [Candidatus Eisenbacteria bacterium]